MTFFLRPLAASFIAAVTLCAQEPAPAPAPKPGPEPVPAKPQPPQPAPAPKPDEPKPGQSPAKQVANVMNTVKTAVANSQASPTPTKKTVADLVKNTDTFNGLFRLYRNRETGAVHLYVRKDQLEREFIYFSHVVDGVAGAGRNRGQFGDATIFVIKRHFEKIEFIEQNTAFYFDPHHPLAKASSANVSHAVLVTEPIVAQDNDGFLLSGNSIFLKEAFRQVKPSTGGNSILGKLAEYKTKFTRLKSFPRNTLLAVEYVYENPTPPARNDDEQESSEVADARYVSVTIQHSLIAMPDSDYQPRKDDPRVGYFMTELTDQTSTEPTPWRDFIHRWHLKKKDPGAAVSEPVEPITWWIENTTPHEFRPTIREAALKWNASFEKIGFKNALVVQEQPDNSEWDADDIEHNVLRWTSSPKPPFGGYGPSFVNPRTGQIIGSDIMLEFSFVKNRIFARKLWSEVGLAGLTDSQEHAMCDPHTCSMAGVMQQGLMLGGQMLRLRKADQIEFDTLMKEAMAQLILHELGHTLGLNHNFRASHLHNPAELQNRALTERSGLSGSVMDYMPLNLGPDKARQGQYYINAPGPYDDWAIEYGYSVAEPNEDKEAQRLATIAARSHEPQLAFANDADDMRSSGKAIDPRAMIFDMSSDPIAYGSERCEMVKQASSKLLQEYSEDGRSWQELLNAYLTLTTEAGNSLTAMSRYIGGVYVERPFIGQVKENAPPPLRPVEAGRQRAAMQALAKYAFAPDSWTAPKGLINHLQQQRRGFDFRNTGEDPKLHERVLKIQSGLLDHLMHGHTQNRILDSALYGNGYPLHEMMRDLTDALVSAKELTAPVNTVRQNLQHEYLTRLINITKNNFFFAPARGIALHEMRRIEAMFQMAQISAPEENKPHIEYVLYRIKQALDSKGA
jgi:hypothetical protein